MRGAFIQSSAVRPAIGRAANASRVIVLVFDASRRMGQCCVYVYLGGVRAPSVMTVSPAIRRRTLGIFDKVWSI